MTELSTESIRVAIDSEGIATLTIDVPGQSANTMSAGFKAELGRLIPQLRGERDLAGIVLTSAKKTFFAGGDLRTLLAVQPEDAQSFYDGLEQFKVALRGMEQLGIPVACAINGAALGGGWEICLCAHARFCLADDKLPLGLPEASLGLLPGAGGVSRMVRKLGLCNALPFLMEGRTFGPRQALAWGLLNGVADNMPAVTEMAKQWIRENPAPSVPWDEPGFRVPNLNDDLALLSRNAVADLLTRGQGRYPAKEAVLACAVEGASVDVDTALRLESRFLTSLATGQIAKNMINTFFFQSGQIKSGKSRPAEVDRTTEKCLHIDGQSHVAMTLALVSASRRVTTVVDAHSPTSKETAERGLIDTVERLVSSGLMTRARAEAAREKVSVQILDRSAATGDELRLADSTSQADCSAVLLGGAEESLVPPGQIGLRAAPDMVGAAVVEVVIGFGADLDQAARVYDFLQQLGKTPLVVSDAPMGFLHRIGQAAGEEALALCREGFSATFVENATLQTDMAVGALTLAKRYGLGHPTGTDDPPSMRVESDDLLREVQDRVLFIQSLEAVKCLDEGVVKSARDANIASVQGIGFPTWTGGVIQYVNQYGLARFIERASEFAGRCGARFDPPETLRRLIASGAKSIEQ